MSIVGYENHHGSTGFVPGSRSRSMRTMVFAGVMLVLIWTIKKSALFRDHYESGFTVINPDHVPSSTANTSDQPNPTATPGAGVPAPIALPGDSFYLTDALHTALNPPPPPPPTPPSPPPPPPPPAVPFSDSAAVIMETDPSKIPNLVPIMLHFAQLLGPKWPVVLVTLKANWIEPASPAFRRLMREQRIKIFFLPEETNFNSHDSVSIFLTQPWFWEQFTSADRVLLFQADSVICANSEASIEDFAQWDLVGAPIASQYGVGYNGGLSLRNPRAMLEVINDPTVPSFEVVLEAHNAEVARVKAEQGEEAGEEANRNVPSWEKFEDQWFYSKLKERESYKLPDTAAAKAFAVETVWHEKPLGYHQPFRWLTAWQKIKAVEWCPELNMLQDASHFF